MCGICGIFSYKGAPVDQGEIHKMTTALAHRGPDGQGQYINGAIGLGHRRLSIIDIDGGAQPITNEDSTIFIVFNGEIYNFIEIREELKKYGHVFRTRSDTEVIVHAYEQWGTSCLSKFNGIFAFAIWDEKSKSLFIGRDHLGVKPLYYVNVEDRIIFASEIKSLLKAKRIERAVSIPALGDLFTYRYVPAPKTLFKGVMKLPAGHYMVCSERGSVIHKYWNRFPSEYASSAESDLIEEYCSLLEESVRLQLRSDVPVGLFLSSGVDSAALLAIMRDQLASPIHTFTIGFQDGERTNETADAENIAKKYGTHHSDLIIGADDYEQYYQRYIYDIEEPVGNESAAAFYFVSKIASEQVKVALTGQGADEPWAGYHRHLGVKLSEMYGRLPFFLRNSMIKPAVMALPLNERLKRGVISLDEKDVLKRFIKVYSFFSADMKKALYGDSFKKELYLTGYEAQGAISHLQKRVENVDPLSQILYIDTRASLPDDLLMVNDKTSMANSIEARVPYLDYRIVEFVEKLPPSFKLRGMTGKYLHKKAMLKWLPKDVVYRKKKGFENPMEKWLRTRMRKYVEDLLLDPQAGVSEFFDAKFISRILASHASRQENHMRQIYLLISFEMWHRRFIRGS